MARIGIANLKGPRGLTGRKGDPGANMVPTDEAVAAYVPSDTKTQKALTENFVASPQVLARLRAGMAARVTVPYQMVFLGDSHVLGTGATSTFTGNGGGFRMVDRVLRSAQARFPSALGTETRIFPLDNARIGRPGIHGYNGGVGGITANVLLNDGRLDSVARIQPDVVWIVIGTNDWNAQYSAATYRTNVETRIDEMRDVLTRPTVFVLVHVWERADVTPPVSTWEEYGEALRGIAADYPDDVAFVNAQVPFATAGAPGDDPYRLITFDKVHATDRGHAMLADEMTRGVIPPGVAEPDLNPLVGYADFGTGSGSMPSMLRGIGWEYYDGGGGEYAVTSGWAHSSGSQIAAFDIGNPYGEFTVKMKRPLSGIAGIGLRMVDRLNRLSLYVRSDENVIILGATIGGVSKRYAQTAENSAPGTILDLRMVVTSGRAQAWKNGVLILETVIPTEDLPALAGATKAYLWQGVSGEAAASFKDPIVTTGAMIGGQVGLGAQGITGWRYLKLAGSLEGYARYIVKDGFDVEVEWSITSSLPEGATVLTSELIPSEFRPAINREGPAVMNTDGRCFSRVTAGGSIVAGNNTGGARTSGDGSVRYFRG